MRHLISGLKNACVLILAIQSTLSFADTGNDFFKSTLVATSGDRMVVGNKYYAPGQQYYVTFQTDGNLVVYHVGVPDEPIWAAASNGGAAALFQSDGNLVVYQSDMVTPKWASNTGNNPNGWNFPQVRIWDNGQLTIEGAAGLYFQTWPDFKTISGNNFFYPVPKCISPGTRIFETAFVNLNAAYSLFNKTVSLARPYGSCALN